MINYIIQLILFQTLFLAVYDLFLHKETFFKWNRIYLLATPILSFIIPLLSLKSLQKTVPQEYIEYLPEVVINPQVYIENSTPFETLLGISTFIFYMGMGFFAILFLVRLTKIFNLIFTSKSIKKDKYTLVLLTKKQSAFSFFNYIFINKHLFEHKDLQIIQHELIHCKHRHTIDLLYFELLKIVMWFNPLVYVYQKRITLLHEYISDAEVVKETDKNIYFNILLAETFNVENISFINQFFKHSLIKKRIVMITKEKSQKMKKLKYLLIAPLLLAMLVFSSFKESAKETLEQFPSIIHEILNEDVLPQELLKKENEAILKSTDTIIQSDDVPFAIIENVPVFPGCEGTQDELIACLKDKIANHININFNSSIADGLGLKAEVKRIFVMFKINKDGNISDVQARAAHIKLQEEAIRVISSLPKMIPGKHKGKAVNVKYSLPIAFKVGANKVNSEIVISYEVETRDNKVEWEYVKGEDVPFAIIEKVPVFPGCEGTESELKACLQEKITNHVSANFNAKLTEGLGLLPGLKKVFVMFKIDKDGNMANIQARAPHKKLEEEAIRVIASLPQMTPGKHKGDAVGVKYALPISFMVEGNVQNDKKKEAVMPESMKKALFILDGKEISKDEMQKIDPNTIKSIEVFKDENAIEKYGKKGKNGVVVITIKE